MDVVAIVAEERRPDHGIVADVSETFAQKRVTLRYRQRQRRIVTDEPGFGRRLIGTEFGVGTVQLARQHLLFFGLAQPISPSLGNASGAAASAARARALSSSICRIRASMLSNFSSSRMKPIKATSSLQP